MSVPEPLDTLRVLHVSHTAYPGGAELALVRLLDRPTAWQASLCAPLSGGAFDKLGHQVRVDRSLPGLPTGGTRSRSPLLAARYLAALHAGARRLRNSPLRADADLLHANTAAAAIICALADPQRTTPLVVHLRDLVSTDSLGRFGYTALRGALRRADGVIANSQSTLQSADGLYPAGAPTAVLQSPIGVAVRRTEARLRPEAKVIGMVGRLQHWKGQHIFLEAFARSFAGTQVRAHIAGAPLFNEVGYADELRRLAQDRGIADQVTFLGHVDDINGFFDSVDIVVHASTRAEPLGQTVIQALAHALPVVATSGGGPGEWIQPGVNGELVEPGDPEALARVLGTLVSSVDRRHALAAGAADTPGIATDDECVQAHAEFFAQVRRIARPATARQDG
ncbi:glycosyltransferase family 4 protein [Micromonospora sp. NBC_01813]|uniref:glycosyltransferase family 4 protein n=1 Tax=Micromonospora sp. NBC_01813 TaxID=2975988 RepID=UPI002DD878F9|nr:glycosyltransferase family 4 protein [Micromonospora sp. NBC_01813]WSA10304.1 glycosyltransferase family 4 protein [Micromonospora sp. NBC_01813]